MRRFNSPVPLTLLSVCLAFVSLAAFAGPDSCANGTCLGPNNPIMMDTVGDGKPDTAIPLLPRDSIGIYTEPFFEVTLPWNCDNNTFQNAFRAESNEQGMFNSYIRFNNSNDQRLNVTESTDSGAFRKAEFFEYPYNDANNILASGAFELLDNNDDGVYETIKLSGDLDVEFDMVGIDADNDGHADYVTLPWASVLSFQDPDSTCKPDGGSVPPISLPLTDTDGDGIPDSVVLDLDGDNVADEGFAPSPKLLTPTVPKPIQVFEDSFEEIL